MSLKKINCICGKTILTDRAKATCSCGQVYILRGGKYCRRNVYSKWKNEQA